MPTALQKYILSFYPTKAILNCQTSPAFVVFVKPHWVNFPKHLWHLKTLGLYGGF